MREIVVLHENEEWLVPLREELKKRGVKATEWFLNEGRVPYTELPEDSVYYNRMSASSHTRGHRYAPELTKLVLTWLESKNRTVVNGSHVLALEICKLSQYAALERAGLRVPKTHAVVGSGELLAAAKAFNQWPLILKPNRGGKGLGVQRFGTLDEFAKFLEHESLDEPLDGTWLLQEYIQPKAPHITRAEFVGQNFVYAVQVNTQGGFELCPADNCAIEDKFTITKRFNDHEIIRNLESFLRSNDIDVAGVEFIENQQGELFVYDVNTNTNYNQAAEQRAAVKNTGMGALAEYLIDLAE
ncbi:ATP-grasp domain-containing protein [Idiomarina seosinensis]|uniref:Alpha-L-glutamate ligase n=1 Tax=Idiomarina seosinensis TaxID=281739 RepID=A0A432Z705_9GAMM|nr:alpha-L-glutamate ligase [Idiomarina seosinensis]RUO73671.1 alpha-L-glutamate ligase [Idiomarina seosinensis]